MAIRLVKDGKLVEKYSAVTGSTEFIEKNEATKEPSLYNVEPKRKGLTNE